MLRRELACEQRKTTGTQIISQVMSDHPSEEQNPKFVTCRCKTCDGYIEFDAASFEDGETREIQCPFCGMDTALYVPAISIELAGAETRVEAPPKLAPPVPPVQPIWFGCPDSRIKLTLTSGTSLCIAKIKLFDAQALQRLATMRATAAPQMGGVSTGLGAIGSLGWVLMATAAIGAVESAMSSAAARQGAEALRNALTLERRIRQTASFFPVGMIDQIEHPLPAFWEVPAQPIAPSGFIHSGDDFAVVQDPDGNSTAVRWGAVENYHYEVGAWA